jgi:hypothetical protein
MKKKISHHVGQLSSAQFFFSSFFLTHDYVVACSRVSVVKGLGERTDSAEEA